MTTLPLHTPSFRSFPAIVFAPETDPSDRMLLSEYRDYCLRYLDPAPPSPSELYRQRTADNLTSAARAAGGAIATLLAGGVVYLVRTATDLKSLAPGADSLIAVIQSILALLALARLLSPAVCFLGELSPMARQERRAAARAVAQHRLYIDPLFDLGQTGRVLLERAQRAADRACADRWDLDARVETSLRERVWRLARELAQLAGWDSELTEARREAGPEIEEVTAERRRAIDSSYRALDERVRELEAYADGQEALQRRRRVHAVAARLDPGVVQEIAANRAVRDTDENNEIAQLNAELALANRRTDAAYPAPAARPVANLRALIAARARARAAGLLAAFDKLADLPDAESEDR